MLLVFAALSLAAASGDLPPAPPRVTLMTIPGREVCALAYDVKRVDLPLAKQRELAAALEAAQLDDLLAAHLRLRTALAAAKKASEATPCANLDGLVFLGENLFDDSRDRRWDLGIDLVC
jgi:hypothetical protein